MSERNPDVREDHHPRRAVSIHLFFAIVVAALIGLADQASAYDLWTRFAERGLGLGANAGVPDALAVFQGYVYAASHERLGDGRVRPVIFRARLSDDTSWSTVLRAWSSYYFPNGGKITGMVVVGAELWIAASGGDLVRLPASSYPRREVPWEWPSTRPILAVAKFQPSPPRTAVACVVREGLEIWCQNGTRWAGLGLPRDLRAASIESARLHAVGRALYVGAGGGSAGSRVCSVFRFKASTSFPASTAGSWNAVTRNCFGSGLTWVTSMHDFNGYVYVGTGGHGTDAGVYRTRGYGYSNVTPAAGMVRWPSMAVSDGRLYVGSHLTPLAGEQRTAAVFVTSDGNAWSRSVEFPVAHATTNALVGQGSRLFAGVLNLGEGFEIWKRRICGFEWVCDYRTWTCRVEWVCR